MPVKADTKLRFCYQDIELYPAYVGNSLTKPTSNPGIDIELLDLIAAESDINIQYVRYSWNRCLALLKAGQVDSVISSYNDERSAIARFPMQGQNLDTTKQFKASGYYLYHLGTEPIWDGIQLLDPGIMIGAPLGYSIVQVMKDRGFKVIETGTTKELLNLLLFKRVDAVTTPGIAADAIISNDPQRYKGIVRNETPVQENLYYLVFSNRFADQNPNLVKTIWQHVPSVNSTHRAAITEKYQQTDTVRK